MPKPAVPDSVQHGNAGAARPHAKADAFGARVVTTMVLVVPLLGVVAAGFSVWHWGLSWIDVGLLAGFYALTTLSITVGYHRLFTHVAFETSEVVRILFAITGSMAVHGSPMNFVGLHRVHHQHCDTPLDPHSPHHGGPGAHGLLRRFWHAHAGWLYEVEPQDMARYVPDLLRSRSMRFVNALFPLWAVLGFVLPALLGGLFSGTWRGALTGFIWGGLVRVFLVHHVVWAVNSACHLWGGSPYRSHDQSRDNVLIGLLCMGEGWHNSHHAFPNSARHGLAWWQLDLSYALDSA